MNRLTRSVAVLALIVLAGCAARPIIKEPTVFYPGPPDPPYIQFLKSFAGSDDLEPPKSAFARFIAGGRSRITIIDKPFGIATSPGKIYVCDTNATVYVLNLEKQTFQPMTEAVQGAGKVIQPVNISIDRRGNKYVTDPVRSQVVMYDKNDLFVKAFGPVEGWKPTDAAPFDDLLYVADVRSFDVKIFDIESGAYRNHIGRGSDINSQLGLPTNLAFDQEGYLYVSDPGRFQVVKLDRDGNGRGLFGTLGRTRGSFARPRGVALDRQNRLYAVDAAFNTVQIFAPDMQLLMNFGKSGQGPGDMVLPAQVAIDYDNVKYFQQYADPNFQIEYLILVTNQFSPRRINVYGFGKMKGQAYKSDEQLLKELKESMEKQEKADAQKQQGEKPAEAPPKKD